MGFIGAKVQAKQKHVLLLLEPVADYGLSHIPVCARILIFWADLVNAVVLQEVRAEIDPCSEIPLKLLLKFCSC